MVVCFDTSALNQLMDDLESDRLTAILLRDFDVWVTAINIIEIGKTTSPERREQLRAFEKRLAKKFEPLDMPNALAQRVCLAFHNQDKDITVTLGEANRQFWAAMSVPNSVDEQGRLALKQWVNALESAAARVGALVRPELDRIFAGNPAERPKTPKQLLRIYMGLRWMVRYGVTAEIYKRATGYVLPLSQLDSFLTAKPSIWPLLFGAEAYSFYYKIVWESGNGSRNRANKLDLWSAVYLPFCDVFVTHDTKKGGQLRALRLLNVFNSRRPRTHVVHWPKFREALSTRGA